MSPSAKLGGRQNTGVVTKMRIKMIDFLDRQSSLEGDPPGLHSFTRGCVGGGGANLTLCPWPPNTLATYPSVPQIDIICLSWRNLSLNNLEDQGMMLFTDILKYFYFKTIFLLLLHYVYQYHDKFATLCVSISLQVCVLNSHDWI